MNRFQWVALAAISVGLLGGCRKTPIRTPHVDAPKDYYRELGPDAAALRKITDPARIPDFRAALADRDGVLAAIDLSIRYMGYRSSRTYFPPPNLPEITHARALASLKDFRALLDSTSSPDEFQAAIVSQYDVYESVGCDDCGTVLFTGYYTPILDASLTPTPEYRWPLYKLPPDLEKDADGRTLGRRTSDGGRVPYYTRGEIDAGALRGHELAYLKDRFDAYVCTIQGSAQLRLPDGTLHKVGYAGNNGYDYASVGMMLVKDGQVPRSKLSLDGLKAFFGAHPEKLDEYLPRNPRYVFFQSTDQPPTGCLNVPVTAYRSVATDKGIFPRACLAYAATQVPQSSAGAEPVQTPFCRFVLDQDAGGAIRAPGRCDIYLGIGDQAGRIAGWTMSEGKLYYLFLKE